MNRRQVLYGGAAILSSAFSPAAQAAERTPVLDSRIKTPRHTLGGLDHYADGKLKGDFSHDGASFYVTYFGMPYAFYESCNVNMAHMALATNLVQERIKSANIFNMLVSMPAGLMPDEPVANLWNTYALNNGKGNIKFQAVTGEFEKIRKIGSSYGARYIIDRHTGNVTDHSQSVCLIGPHGERLALYKKDADPFELAAHIAGVIDRYKQPSFLNKLKLDQ